MNKPWRQYSAEWAARAVTDFTDEDKVWFPCPDPGTQKVKNFFFFAMASKKC